MEQMGQGDRISNAILITNDSFSNASFRESGLRELKRAGWNVEVWIVGNVRGIADCYDGICDKCEIKYFATYYRYDRAVKSYSESSWFYSHIARVPDPLLVPLSKYRCRYIVQENRTETPKIEIKGSYYESEEKTYGQKILEWIERIRGERFKYIVRKVTEILNSRYCKAQPVISIEQYLPRAVFTTNELSLERAVSRQQEWISKCKIVYVPSSQYDYYLEEERKGECISEDFILLVASGLGFKYEGARESVYKEDIYREDVNKLFLERMETMLDKMEEHYGLPLIVAGHPRGIYKDYDFGGRKIVFGNTPELVKKCKICISTITYAMSFPILYDKRVLFYYCDAIKKTLVWKCLYVPYMEELELRGINLDHTNEIDKPWEYEESIRPALKKEYIKKYHNVLEPGDKLYGEILNEFLNDDYRSVN